MNWTGGRTLAVGIALIAGTNAIALGGVAWNRSGDPDSVLALSRREFVHSYQGRYDPDRTGVTLDLRWRVLTPDTAAMGYGGPYGAPEWLDREKLATLGFDVSPPTSRRAAAGSYERQLPREALIVLELDGPTYRTALARARARAEQEAAGAPGPDAAKGWRAPGRPAAEALKQEETANTRLFAVDAGPDAAALRAKYPDRTRYAVVRGRVRAQFEGGARGGALWKGYVQEILNARVNVPGEFRETIGTMPRPEFPAMAGKLRPMEVRVAFGKRFEPWIVAASPAP